MICVSSEMDGTHGRTTFEDDLGHQLLRRQTIVNGTMAGASWEQNANAGNDSSNRGEPNGRETFHYWKGYSITEETKSVSQLMPTINPSDCACSQELEHSHIQQVLPISVSRILATQHTTMMKNGGGCRCKER